MKSSLIILAILISSMSSVYASGDPVLRENIYYQFQKQILNINAKSVRLNGFTHFEQALYVDALWDLTEEGSPEAIATLNEVVPVYYNLLEKLRLGILRLKYKRSANLSDELVTELMNALREPNSDVKIIYTLAAYEKEIMAAGHTDLIEQAKLDNRYQDVSEDSELKKEFTNDMLTDIFYNTPDVTTYMNGEYIKSVKIFMFCRSNRLFPCLMTMKNAQGEIVRNADGSIWTQRALASSKQGLPSYSRNGNTPAGIHFIDSVMPSADQNVSFGKFRRMILNFVPKSKNEILHLALLPESSKNKDWWKPATVARDIGRNDLRIHGTGKVNEEPTTPYFPFMRTNGCISQRENTYEGIVYRDQRELLDSIMTAMDLAAVYENELKIKGILYLIEVDGTNEPMTLKVLNDKGIE